MSHTANTGMAGLIPMLRLDALKMSAQFPFLIGIIAAGTIFNFYGGPQAALPLFMATGMILAANIISQDELYRLNGLYGTLPLSRRAVITSHYLVGIALQITCIILAVGAVTTANYWKGTEIQSEIVMTVVSMSLITAFFTLQVPLQIKFGSQRAPLLFIGIIFLLAISGKIVWEAVQPDPTLLETALSWIVDNRWMVVVAIIGILAVLLSVSWAVTVRLYERQDH